MTEKQRRIIIMLHDMVAIGCAFMIAYWMRFNLTTIPTLVLKSAWHFLPWVMMVQFFTCYAAGLYRGYWRFASMPDLLRIIKSIVLGTLFLYASLFLLTGMNNVPRAVLPLYLGCAILFLGGSRFVYRWFRDYQRLFKSGQRVLIVGAGEAGESLIRDLLKQGDKNYLPVVLVDDDSMKQGRDVHGVRIKGTCATLETVARHFAVDLIFIAMPNATSAKMREVFDIAQRLQLPCRTLPSMHDLIEGRVDIKSLRDISLDDLLGRDPVQLDWQSIEMGVAGKTVLVSGGGGSIGAELCRQIGRLKPALLIIVDHSEYNLYAIDMEMHKLFPAVAVQSHLLSVTDQVALATLFSKYAIDIVFHAAAYKHVPLLENQLRCAMQNNILGTRALADVAIRYHVKRFVLISTDKAVKPANIMGSTKRVAEMLCQSYHGQSHTKFIIVRFGNVLGSAGSVVPLFRQQLAEGGPITVTHPEMTRFFMTIPESCQLILQASVVGEGGEVFVLDMGEPIKIRYLAEQMIRLSGLKNIAIHYIGLRPGEKLYEELFYDKEELQSTDYDKLLRATSQGLPFAMMNKMIEHIATACTNCDEEDLRKILYHLVPQHQVSREEHHVLSHVH